MKKIIQCIALLLLIVIVVPVSAGIQEDSVVKLLNQSPAKEGLLGVVSGSENLDFNINLKLNTTEPGKQAKIDNFKLNGDFVVTYDIPNKLAQIEGTASVVYSPLMSVSLPLNFYISIENEQLYAFTYIYPKYAEYMRMFGGGTVLDTYVNTWIKIPLDKSILKDLEYTQKSSSGVFNSTKFFTATSRKVSGSTMYTVKFKSVEVLKLLNDLSIANGGTKLTAKDRAILTKIFKGITFQVAEKNGKLAGYNGSVKFSHIDTKKVYSKKLKKNVTETINGTLNASFKSTVLTPKTLIAPSQYRLFNLDDLAPKPETTTATADSLGLTYTIPAVLTKSTLGKPSSSDTQLLNLSENDDFSSRINIYGFDDAEFAGQIATLRTDQEAQTLFAPLNRPEKNYIMKAVYLKKINGWQYVFVEDSFVIPDGGKDYPVKSVSAYLSKNGKVYIFDFQDDATNFDRTKTVFDGFMQSVGMR